MAYNTDNYQVDKKMGILGNKTQEKLDKKYDVSGKVRWKFFPSSVTGDILLLSQSYCLLIRTAATPIFSSFSFSISPS